MKQVVALPSDSPGGLDVDISSHFGHCEFFTIVTIEDSQLQEVKIVPNPPEQQRGCMSMVDILSSYGVNVLIVSGRGIGIKPLRCLKFAGIQILNDHQFTKVKDALDAFMQNQLSRFRYTQACESGTGKCFKS